MKTLNMHVFVLSAITALVMCQGVALAENPVRGMVEDRTSKFLWLGLPGPARQGSVFDVMLVPGSEVIAKARVVDCTPDSPFVAKARFQMVDAKAFVPIGAYAETARDVVPDTDKTPGYKDVGFHEETAKRLNLDLGVLFPSDSQVRDETQSSWLAMQLSYRLGRSERSTSSVGLGFYQGQGDFSVGGKQGNREFHVYPVTWDVKIPACRDKSKGWFYRLGIGAYWVSDKRTIDGDESDSTNNVKFGGQAGIGYESKKGCSAQVYYTDASSGDFKGPVFSVGARF